jgi:hypothetical protein
MVSQMWAGGHAESCGAGVTVMESLDDVIVKVEMIYLRLIGAVAA